MIPLDSLNYSEPRFTTSQAAAACDVPASTFRSYFQQRGKKPPLLSVVGKMDARKADEHGAPNLFSLRDIMGFAVTLALIERGIEPSEAFFCGMLEFAHTGSDGRVPGAMFDVNEQGYTLLIYAPKSGNSRIVQTEKIKGIQSLWLGLNDVEPAIIVLVLNHIEAAVFASLGIPWQLGNGKAREAAPDRMS